MGPKRSIAVENGGYDQDSSSRKRPKVRDPDSTDEEIDELASESEYDPKSGSGTLRTRKARKKASPASKNTPKAPRRRDPNNKTNLRKARATANKKVKELEHDMKLREDKERQLEEEKLRSQNQVRILKERELASKEQGGQYMQDDETIKQSLNDLSKMIWDWSASWARKGTIAQRTGDIGFEYTLKVLQGQHGISHPALRNAIDEQLVWQPGGPRVAVQTILEHLVAEKLLLRPFHFLELGSSDGKGLSEAASKTLYSRMRDDCLDKALWHARTLRSLYAPHQSQTSSVEPILGDSFEIERSAIRGHLVELCLSSERSLLSPLLTPSDDHVDARRRAGLSRIFEVAAKVSLQIWIQGAVPTVQWQGTGCFADNFDPSHTHFDPHQLMKSDIEDESLVKRRVDWVVRPCIAFRRHYADGSQSTDTVALKGQVMLLNAEKCRSEALRQNGARQEPTNSDVQISDVQPSGVIQNQVVEAKDVYGEVVQAQKDSDHSIIISATTPVTESHKDNNMLRSKTARDDHETETVRDSVAVSDLQRSQPLQGVHVDRDVTGPLPFLTNESGSERKTITRSSSVDRGSVLIDLTIGDLPDKKGGLQLQFQGRQEQGHRQGMRAPVPEPGGSLPRSSQQEREPLHETRVQVNQQAGETHETQSGRSYICADDERRAQAAERALSGPEQIHSTSSAGSLALWYDFGDQVLQSATPKEYDEWHLPGNATDTQHSPSNLDRLSGNKSRHKLRSESVMTETQAIDEPGKHSIDLTSETPSYALEEKAFQDAPEQLSDSTSSSLSLGACFEENHKQNGEWTREEHIENELIRTARQHDSHGKLGDDLLQQNGTINIAPSETSNERSDGWEDPGERRTSPPHISEDSMGSSDRQEIAKGRRPMYGGGSLGPLHEDPQVTERYKQMQELMSLNQFTKDIVIRPDENIGRYLARKGHSSDSGQQNEVTDLQSSDVAGAEPGDGGQPEERKIISPYFSQGATGDKNQEGKP